jgi:hypothetical protein
MSMQPHLDPYAIFADTRRTFRSNPLQGGVMNLATLFIKRPITTTLIMLGIWYS